MSLKIFACLNLMLLLSTTTHFVFAQSKDYPFHENAGCPMDAVCNKESGKIFAAYDALLEKQQKEIRFDLKSLQNFYQKHGLLFEGWVSSSFKQEKIAYATWPMNCAELKNKFDSIHFFAKSLHPSSSSGILLHPIIIQEKKKKQLLFFPKNHLPSLLPTSTTMQLGSFYYTLNIDEQGNISLSEMKKSGDIYQTPIACPKELLQFYEEIKTKKLKNYEGLFSGERCYQKQHFIILVPQLPFSC